jgi:hypothetical protein
MRLFGRTLRQLSIRSLRLAKLSPISLWLYTAAERSLFLGRHLLRGREYCQGRLGLPSLNNLSIAGPIWRHISRFLCRIRQSLNEVMSRDAF